LWLIVAACGCSWLLVAACVRLWLLVPACGCLWLFVPAYGCDYALQDSFIFYWGGSWGFLLGVNGPLGPTPLEIDFLLKYHPICKAKSTLFNCTSDLIFGVQPSQTLGTMTQPMFCFKIHRICLITKCFDL
jgi:hypothetical protein